MSTANTPEVQIIYDDNLKAIVKVVGFYNAATNNSNTVVQANTLFGANTSANAPLPILSLARVVYSSGLANGYMQIQWVGKNGGSNNDAVILGARTSGDIPQYINNPLTSSNTSNTARANTTGDVQLIVTGAEPFDSYTIVMTFNKENPQGGWANGFVGYNASDYQH